MDKRKLISRNSLLKDVQPINPSLERINSSSDKQMSSHITNMMTQEESESFHERSDIRSSTLKSLNIHSKENNSSVNDKKRYFCETENNVSETDDFAVTSQVLKKISISKQLCNQVSANTSFVTSQQEDIHLSKNNVSMTNKSLDATNPSVAKSTMKRKIANLSEDSASDIDLDFSYNERNIMKKKRNKTVLDRNTKPITQDTNISHSSPKKVCRESIRTITEPHISQRKQDKPKEFQSSTKLEKYKINKKSEKYIIDNKQHLPEKQNFHVPSVFSNFLQKCGLMLSTDGIHTLSKFLCYTYLLFFN